MSRGWKSSVSGNFDSFHQFSGWCIILSWKRKQIFDCLIHYIWVLWLCDKKLSCYKDKTGQNQPRNTHFWPFLPVLRGLEGSYQKMLLIWFDYLVISALKYHEILHHVISWCPKWLISREIHMISRYFIPWSREIHDNCPFHVKFTWRDFTWWGTTQ